MTKPIRRLVIVLFVGALVLAAWCLGGLILCLTTFRWQGRKDG